jgi:GDSL-like Lipase/Acylhydrolase family
MALRSPDPGVVLFSVSTPSRHPANAQAYDPNRHRYLPGYVNPRSWMLNLAAPLMFDRETGGPNPPVPPGVGDCEWRVSEIGGSFQKVLSGNARTMERVAVKVPRPGEYLIEHTVKRTDGGQDFHDARRYRLHDLFVVSLGDSYAAGQGNPDAPAVLSADDAAACRATTLRKAYPKILAGYREFRPFFGPGAALALLKLAPLGRYVDEFVKSSSDFIENAISANENAIANAAQLAVDSIQSVAGVVIEFFGGDDDDNLSPHPARWQEPMAYRSYGSGPSLAARLAESDSGVHANRVTFLSFARSGSTIRGGLLGPRTSDGLDLDPWIGSIGQVEEARSALSGRRIDVLLLSIGGNDVGFAGALEDLVVNDLRKDDAAQRQAILRTARRKLNRLVAPGGDYDRLNMEIRQKLNPARILITEYPTGLFSKLRDGIPKDGGGCEVFSSTLDLDITIEDAREVHALGVELNQRIEQKAKQLDWEFVSGVDVGFAGRGYCADSSFFVSAEQSCLRQGDLEGTMHPNKDGHDVYAACIVRAIGHRSQWLEPVLATMS